MRNFKTAVFAVLVTLTWVSPALAGQSGFSRWAASQGGFSSWQRSGVALAADGSLQVDPQTAVAGTDPYAPGAYNGGNFYNGGSFRVGEGEADQAVEALSAKAVDAAQADAIEGAVKQASGL